MTTSAPLPEYANPPVIEVVVGVQFVQLEGLQAPHLGLFWDRIRGQFPQLESQVPLAPVVERFGETDSSSQAITVETLVTSFPVPRAFFIEESGHRLIQLQSDRLLINWRMPGKDGEQTYPRFPAIFSLFKETWHELTSFCVDEKIGPIDIQQAEVTYINHIRAGETWSTVGDMGKVFVDLQWSGTHHFLPSPSSINSKFSFEMPDESGRLHVSIRHGKRKVDLVPVFLCELTARGAPRESTDAALFEWIEYARSWVVNGFADMMSNSIQVNEWKRI